LACLIGGSCDFGDGDEAGLENGEHPLWLPLLGLRGGGKKESGGTPPNPPEGNLGSLHLPVGGAGDSIRGETPLVGARGCPPDPSIVPPKSGGQGG